MSDFQKLLIFLAIFLFVVPVGSLLSRRSQPIRAIAFGLMIFFTSWSFMIHIAPLPDWTGTARGYALSMVDIFASILLLGMVLDPDTRVSWRPPGAWLYALYFLFVLISGSNAMHLLQWGFEVCKMFWMYVFFLAAYNYLRHARNFWLLIYPICFTLGVVLVYGIYQKYFGGVFQISSTLPHQNSLALYVTLFGCLVLGVLLNEKANPLQIVLLGSAFSASLLLVIFTYSRGGLLCFFLGCGLTGALSMLFNRLTARKLSLSALGMIFVILALSYALPRIISRFQNAPEASYTTRVFLNRAAVRIANDYFLGVGANNFSEYSGPFRHYAAEQHAQVRITEETSPYGPIVESVYLLVAAECGYLGMLALIGWLYYYLALAIRLSFRLRNCYCAGLIIGCVGGLTANYLQSFLEWTLKQYANFYQLMLLFAVISVIWVEQRTIAATRTDDE